MEVADLAAEDLEGEGVAREIAVAAEREEDQVDGAVAEGGVEDGEAVDVGTRSEVVVQVVQAAVVC